jgi:hypothetical protein
MQIYLFLFISDLFDDVTSSLHYIASDPRHIKTQLTGKNVEGSGCGLI